MKKTVPTKCFRKILIITGLLMTLISTVFVAGYHGVAHKLKSCKALYVTRRATNKSVYKTAELSSFSSEIFSKVFKMKLFSIAGISTVASSQIKGIMLSLFFSKQKTESWEIYIRKSKLSTLKNISNNRSWPSIFT